VCIPGGWWLAGGVSRFHGFAVSFQLHLKIGIDIIIAVVDDNVNKTNR